MFQPGEGPRVGAFSVIVQCVVEPMDRFTALAQAADAAGGEEGGPGEARVHAAV